MNEFNKTKELMKQYKDFDKQSSELKQEITRSESLIQHLKEESENIVLEEYEPQGPTSYMDAVQAEYKRRIEDVKNHKTSKENELNEIDKNKKYFRTDSNLKTITMEIMAIEKEIKSKERAIKQINLDIETFFAEPDPENPLKWQELYNQRDQLNKEIKELKSLKEEYTNFLNELKSIELTPEEYREMFDREEAQKKEAEQQEESEQPVEETEQQEESGQPVEEAEQQEESEQPVEEAEQQEESEQPVQPTPAQPAQPKQPVQPTPAQPAQPKQPVQQQPNKKQEKLKNFKIEVTKSGSRFVIMRDGQKEPLPGDWHETCDAGKHIENIAFEKENRKMLQRAALVGDKFVVNEILLAVKSKQITYEEGQKILNNYIETLSGKEMEDSSFELLYNLKGLSRSELDDEQKKYIEQKAKEAKKLEKTGNVKVKPGFFRAIGWGLEKIGTKINDFLFDKNVALPEPGEKQSTEYMNERKQELKERLRTTGKVTENQELGQGLNAALRQQDKIKEEMEH